MAKIKAEYIWIDGHTPTPKLRSKTRIIDGPITKLTQIPAWGFDGSSTLQGEGYLIEDLGSSNGTFVNGEQISKATPLKNGDLISLGKMVQVEYQAPGTFDMVEMSEIIEAAVASQPDGLVVTIPDADELEIVQGKGATGRINGKPYWLGSHRYMGRPAGDGYIITNNHVVSGRAPKVIVTLADRTQHEAEVLARDPVNDLALLRVPGADLTAFALGSAAAGLALFVLAIAASEERLAHFVKIHMALQRHPGSGEAFERCEVGIGNREQPHIGDTDVPGKKLESGGRHPRARPRRLGGVRHPRRRS